MRNFLHWLLRLTHPPEDASAILGDLDEERAASRGSARGVFRGGRWYAGQLVAALVAPLKERPMRRAHEQRWSPVRSVMSMGDFRYSLRRWRRRPGFVLAVVATLGLGVGAATAMFSVIDAVLLQPLPWAGFDRLVVVHAVHPEARTDPARAATWDRRPLHYPAWDALRTGSSFDDVGVWRMLPRGTTLGEDRTVIVETMTVSSNLLPILGVRTELGRYFTAEEDDVNSDNVMLTYEAWQSRFGGRPDIVGLPISTGSATGGERYTWTVVGVLAPGFSFAGATPELIRPVGVGAEVSRRYFNGSFRSVARLASGVSVDAATAEASSLLSGSSPDEPAWARVVPIVDEHLGEATRPLWLLFGGAGVLLLVACANVAGLLIGEGRTRRHEIAVRLALGISTGRVVRQLLMEHLALAAAGALAGLALSVWLTASLVAIAPAELPRLDSVRVNWRAAGFALAAGGVTMLLFGLTPAWSLARTRATEVLAEGGRSATPGRRWAQRAVVAGEVALALVLVVGAALLGETMYRLLSQPAGFDPANLAVARVVHTGSTFGPDGGDILRRARQTPGTDLRKVMDDLMLSAGRSRTEQGTERIAALPGVVGVAASSGLPFLDQPASTRIGRDGLPTERWEHARQQLVTESYFSVMGMPLLSGRGFDEGDYARWQSQVVVSAGIERRLFPEGAVGRQVKYTWNPETGETRTYDVIGVVPDVKQRVLSEDGDGIYYILGPQTLAPTYFVVRTSDDSATVLPAMRQAIADVNPQLVVTATHTMEGLLGRSMAEERFRAMLSTGFAGAALLLAIVGLYGVAARQVAERRRELGIRVALGARPAQLRRLVLGDGLATVGLGLVIGLPAAVLVSRLVESFLFGVAPTAPHIFAVASAGLVLSALAAALLPAHRAGRIDPVLVLKD